MQKSNNKGLTLKEFYQALALIFWKFENKKWDLQTEQDINEHKLGNIVNEALDDYERGKFKSL